MQLIKPETTMPEGTVFYHVLKPAPVLNPDGSQQWGVIAQSPNLEGALQAIMQTRLTEYRIVLGVCIVAKVPENMASLVDAVPANGFNQV